MPVSSMEQAMGEFKRGEMHSGKGGPVVKNRKQAIAIALSETKQSKRNPRRTIKTEQVG